jgi:hypothetical protein
VRQVSLYLGYTWSYGGCGNRLCCDRGILAVKIKAILFFTDVVLSLSVHILHRQGVFDLPCS